MKDTRTNDFTRIDMLTCLLKACSVQISLAISGNKWLEIRRYLTHRRWTMNTHAHIIIMHASQRQQSTSQANHNSCLIVELWSCSKNIEPCIS